MRDWCSVIKKKLKKKSSPKFGETRYSYLGSPGYPITHPYQVLEYLVTPHPRYQRVLGNSLYRVPRGNLVTPLTGYQWEGVPGNHSYLIPILGTRYSVLPDTRYCCSVNANYLVSTLTCSFDSAFGLVFFFWHSSRSWKEGGWVEREAWGHEARLCNCIHVWTNVALGSPLVAYVRI